MNPHLLLRLPEQPEQPVHWLIWSQENKATKPATVDVIDSGFWPSVSAFIENRASTTVNGQTLPTIVLVPSAKVTLHTLDIQGRMTSAIRQSLPWRLEDELSDDVDNLHFAILHHGNNQAHMAVTGKSDMALWQHWLTQAGVTSKRWLPDALMLPVKDNQCCLQDIDGLTIARYGQWQTAVCDSQWLPLFLDGLSKEQPDLEISEADKNDHTSLSVMAAEASKTEFNLLQGQWQPASPWRQRLRPWVSTAVIASALLGLVTINSILNTRQLEQSAEAYQQQAQGIYRKLFPGERVVRLQSQMRQKLAALQQPEKTSQSMLTLLAQITPVLNAFPEMKASSMSFSVNDSDSTRQILRIQAQASDFELFTRFRERFQKDLDLEELNIAIEALQRTGDKVTGMLVISGGLS